MHLLVWKAITDSCVNKSMVNKRAQVVRKWMRTPAATDWR